MRQCGRIAVRKDVVYCIDIASTSVDFFQFIRHRPLRCDQGQSIKPSDADNEVFQYLKSARSSVNQQLLSQFGVKAGQPYVEFVNNLLNCRVDGNTVFVAKNYEFEVLDSLCDMVNTINEKERQAWLSRLIAGYS